MAISKKEKKQNSLNGKAFIRIFDELEGELMDPIEFVGVKDKFDGTWWYVNEEIYKKDLEISQIPKFDKVMIPSTKKLKFEDQYKTLAEVEKQIEKVQDVLERGEVPAEEQDEKNILDYERDLYELSLLEDKLRYGRGRYIQRAGDGMPIITFVRKGNVPLALSYNVETRKIWLPTDQQIQNYTSRNREIDFMFPLKKESKWNFRNAITVFMVLLCLFFLWGIYDNKQVSKENQQLLVICEEQKASLNAQWGKSNVEQAGKIGTAIDKLANIQEQTKTSSSNPPPNSR